MRYDQFRVQKMLTRHLDRILQRDISRNSVCEALREKFMLYPFAGGKQHSTYFRGVKTCSQRTLAVLPEMANTLSM